MTVAGGRGFLETGNGYHNGKRGTIWGMPILQRSTYSLKGGSSRAGGRGDPRGKSLSTCPCAKGKTGDPIDTQTGGFDYSLTGLSLPTVAGPLVFELTYASLTTATYTTTVGYGWTHNLDTRLITPTAPGGEPNVLWFKAHDSNQYRFEYDEDTGTYNPYPGVLASLTLITPTYVLTTAEQSMYTFNLNGQLTRWTDAQGHNMVYSYTNSLVTTVTVTSTTPSLQHFIVLTYTPGTGRISMVGDDTGRQVAFGYDTNGDLTSMTDVLGQTWNLGYSGTTHLLSDVRDPNDISPAFPTLHTDYDAQGRAWQQLDGLGNLIVQVTYYPTASVMVDARGNIQTHLYNNLNTVTDEDAPLGAFIDKAYDANFRPAVITDSLSHPTTMIWSDDGINLTRTIDALGQAVDLTYDDFNNLTQTVDARGLTTKMAYTGTLLTVVTDTLNNRTLYTYTTAADAPQPKGLLKAATDARGYTSYFEYNALGLQTVMTDTMGTVSKYGYDNLGRLITSTVAAGRPQQQISVNQYDKLGRLTQTTRNYTSTVGVDPTLYNLISQFEYDAVGNQVAMTDTVGQITRTFYDNANRPISTTANFTTTVGVDPTAYNLTTLSGYDTIGNRVLVTDTVGRVTKTEYDALNRPVTVTVNYTTTSGLGPDYNIKRVAQYDTTSNVVASIENYGTSLARTTVMRYDELYRPISVTSNFVGNGQFNIAYPDQNITSLTRYDTNSNVISATQFYGAGNLERTTVTGYDELNRPISTTANFVGNGQFNSASPDQNITSLVRYDTIGNVISATQFYGAGNLERTNLTLYDAANRPISVTTNYDPNPPSGATDRNLTALTRYDPVGNVISTTMYAGTSLARTSLARYDALYRPISTTVNFTGNGQFNSSFPDQNLTSLTQYDAAGNVFSTTALAGTSLARTSYTQYDSVNRPITVTANYTGTGQFNGNFPDRNLIQSFVYDKLGNRLQAVETRGGPGLPTTLITTTFAYDALNRPITATTPLTGTAVAGATTTYDGRGRVVDSVDPMGRVTRTEYDGLDRPVKVIGNYLNGVYDSTKPDEDLITTYQYDAVGNRTTMTDPKNTVTRYNYDLGNRLIGVWENYQPPYSPTADINVHTVYTYNAVSNLVNVLDARGQVMTNTYDLLNRPVSAVNPLGQTTVYTYNVANNQIAMQDAKLQVTNYAYDLLNRPVNVDYPGADADVTLAYDAAGQRTTMIDGTGATSWDYDLVGRPLTITQPTVGAVSYSYDSASNRTQLHYPDGKVVTYTYDLAARVVSVKDWANAATDYAYNAGSELTVMTLPNGVTSNYAYDAAHRLKSLTHQTQAETLATYTYAVDAIGNRTAVTETLFTPGATLGFSAPTSNIVVNSIADDTTTNGNCTLREAIKAANLNTAVDACAAGQSGSADAILLPAGTYTLSLTGSGDYVGDIDLISNVSLNGAGVTATIITGGSGWASRIFDVASGVTVNLNNLTVTKGNDSSSGGALANNSGQVTLDRVNLTTNIGKHGGAIYNASATSVLTLTNSTLQNNIANDSASAKGGGIYNLDGIVVLSNTTVLSNTANTSNGGGIYSTGKITVTASAILSNTAKGTNVSGGGLYNLGVAVFTNTTLSGNKATKDGGGIASFNNGSVTAYLTLTNSTLTNNIADSEADNTGDGGGVRIGSGVGSFWNTLMAGNTDSSSTTKHPDCSGTFISKGYNLIQSTTGCTITGDTTGNITGQSANLDVLANNGGPTWTHALLTSSPAIDAGNPATPGSGGYACPTTDQRGVNRPLDGDNNGTARCDIGAYEKTGSGPKGPSSGSSGAPVKTTITYTYDGLYRLASATYSSGANYAYTYDEVGNRLTEETCVGTCIETSSTYDAANRLIQVGTQTYTWDNNGNLLNDGAMAYTYDAANRPITITQGANTYGFTYNGQGDRAKQTVNSSPTNYTLDLNAGLTQVLADGNNTYLYGSTRIGEQQSSNFIYHLPDALGSVRQLANVSGAVTVAKTYQPFGEVMSTAGSGTSLFGWAGEARDATGLVFLRARFYSPTTGRFFVRDSWPGNQQMPGTLHPYLYGLNNPTLYTDPSGRCVFGGIDTVICIGAVLGAGVAYATQVYDNYQSNNNGNLWEAATTHIDGKKILIGGLIGAVGAGVGAAIIPTVATGAGTWAATTFGVSRATATFVADVALAGGTNLVLGAVQRGANHYIDGGEITSQYVVNDLQQNAGRDFLFGAASSVLGQTLNNLISGFVPNYKPYNVPSISNIRFPVNYATRGVYPANYNPLITPYIRGVMQVGAQTLSDSGVLDFVLSKFAKADFHAWQVACTLLAPSNVMALNYGGN